MSDLDYPATGLAAGVGLLLLDLLPALLDMRDVVSLFDRLLCRLPGVPLVGAQVLPALGTVDDNGIEHPLQLADVMPMGPGYDDRQRDPTAVHQQMTLAAVFFPDPSGWDRRCREPAGP